MPRQSDFIRTGAKYGNGVSVSARSQHHERRPGMEQLMNAFLLALLSMPHPMSAATPPAQIENWPQLTVTEHLVAAVPPACHVDGTGCAVVKLDERTCNIYIAWREPRKAVVRARQMKRCRGYDEAPFPLKAVHSKWVAAGKPYTPQREAEHRALATAALD
jgi:hypothetical protein